MPVKKLVLLLLFSFLLLQGKATEPSIRLVESNAFIKNNELKVEMLFSNSGMEQKQVTINVNYIGQLDTVVETVPGNSTKLLSYRISNVRPGEVRFAVLADNNSFIKVIVPEDLETRDVLLVRAITAGEWKKSLPEEGVLSKLSVAFNHLLTSPDAMAVVTVLLIAVATLLTVKIAFRKKTDVEKKIKSSEQLLKEVKEIEEKRKRVQKKLK